MLYVFDFDSFSRKGALNFRVLEAWWHDNFHHVPDTIQRKIDQGCKLTFKTGPNVAFH